MSEFHNDGTIANGINTSFVTLLPKVADPIGFADFRPINLIGCIYKVISKTLANRLKLVIGSVVSESQNAFITNRSILDGPLILNELVAWLKKNKKKGMIFKIDFEKAFDTLNWNFLDSVMEQMSFPNQWRMWIRSCLCSASTSILINGAPSKEFIAKRGVRQGDPLAPFLFILAIEALHVAAQTACERGHFQGIKTPNSGPILSKMFYADDVVFTGEWSIANGLNISRLLRCFRLASGLQVNITKTTVYGVGVTMEQGSVMASVLGCKYGALPFTYLGLPVGANMNLIKNWDPVVKKLSSWKANTLSFGGKITLIKAVLGNLPIHYFSLFKAPTQVIKKLEGLRRSFLWGGLENSNKISWVAWDKIITPRVKGGWGIGSLKAMNMALLMKWLWRFKTDDGAEWVDFIKAFHVGRKVESFPVKKSIAGVWSGIHRAAEETREMQINIFYFFKCSAGNGADTSFWCDNWNDSGTLMDSFPVLFALDANKRASVAEMFQIYGNRTMMNWEWIRQPSSMQEVSDLMSCLSILQYHVINDVKDRWLCSIDSSGLFSVKALRRLLDEEMAEQFYPTFESNKWVPIKVNFFVWRAGLDRIATRMALQRRNIQILSSSCPCCGMVDESVNHLLLVCSGAAQVWNKIWSWC